MQNVLDWFKTDTGMIARVVLYIVCAVTVTLLMALISRKLFNRWIRRHRERGSKEQVITVLHVLRRIVAALIYFCGAMAVIGQVPGLNRIATSLLAGSGVIAIALSVAAQASVGNLVSGVLLNIFKPFRVGDTIRYLNQDITGVVEEITLRHTVVRTYENKRLIIPNSTMNTEVIENASFGSRTVCLFLDVTVSYESNLDLALQIVAEQIRQHPEHIDVRTAAERQNGAPEVTVRVKDFLDSGILLRGFLWAADSLTALRVKSDVLRSIKKAFDAKGIEIPYPHQTVLLRNETEVQPKKTEHVLAQK